MNVILGSPDVSSVDSGTECPPLRPVVSARGNVSGRHDAGAAGDSLLAVRACHPFELKLNDGTAAASLDWRG